MVSVALCPLLYTSASDLIVHLGNHTDVRAVNSTLLQKLLSQYVHLIAGRAESICVWWSFHTDINMYIEGFHLNTGKPTKRQLTHFTFLVIEFDFQFWDALHHKYARIVIGM